MKPTNAICEICSKETYPIMFCICPERQKDGDWKEEKKPRTFADVNKEIETEINQWKLEHSSPQDSWEEELKKQCWWIFEPCGREENRTHNKDCKCYRGTSKALLDCVSSFLQKERDRTDIIGFKRGWEIAESLTIKEILDMVETHEPNNSEINYEENNYMAGKRDICLDLKEKLFTLLKSK